jgi:hypothetical protein
MAPSVEVPLMVSALPVKEAIGRSDDKHSIIIPPETLPLPNPSLQITADHNLKQVEAPVYQPGRGEVLLHIKATGICGYFSSQRIK